MRVVFELEAYVPFGTRSDEPLVPSSSYPLSVPGVAVELRHYF